MSKRMDEIKDQLTAWARRPPERSATAARASVLAALDDRRRPLLWQAGAVLAAVAAIVVLGVALFRPPTPPDDGQTAEAASPEHRSLLVYELGSGAKLYFSLGAGGAWQGQDGSIERSK